MTDNSATNSQGQNGSVPAGVASAQVEGDAPELETTEQAEGEETEGTQQTEEEFEEVEREGKKYRVPKPLKGELMMHGDYTRKTQELAEQRRAWEAQATQHVTRDQEITKGYGRLYALDESLAQYQKVNWQELRQQNPTLADDHWFQYQQLKDQRGNIVQDLQQKENQRGLDEQRTRARQIEESRAVLARDIGYNADLDVKLRTFSEKTLGLSPEEIFAISTEPKYVKAIHRAYLGEQAIKELAALKKASANAEVKPVPSVGSNSGSSTRRTNDPSGDKLSTEEWMKREAARKKG